MLKFKVLFFLMIAQFALTTDLTGQDVDAGLKKGDALLLGGYFEKEVDLSFFEKDKKVSKREAISMLRNFFDAHPVVSYRRTHISSSKTNRSHLVIGKLKSENSESFKVWLYYTNADQPQITEIRIARE